MLSINKKKITILLIPFVIYGLTVIYLNRQATTVKAFGDLTVNFGVPSEEPIFTIENMLPGECQSREIIITNDADKTAHVAIKSDNANEDDSLSEVLRFEIFGDSQIYSATLNQFFKDSKENERVNLGELLSGEDRKYEIKLCFDKEATNAYSGKSVEFDLILKDLTTHETKPHGRFHHFKRMFNSFKFKFFTRFRRH